MNKLNRRKFLALAGASSAVVTTGGAISLANLSNSSIKGNTLTFRAVAGLPSKLMPAYASYVIEGHVDIASRSGVLTQTLYAGAPKGKSTIAFPGQSRIVRVTDVQELGSTLRVTGVIDDRSQLLQGESPTFNILIDSAQAVARTSRFGSELMMHLE